MNTKTRRILSVLLVLCMSFALMATAAFAADTETEDVAKIALSVSALGESNNMTVTAKADVTMTEDQAKAAATLGAEELAKKEFTCTLSDSAKFLGSVEAQVKAAKISLNEGSIFEMKSFELKDGALNVTYVVKADAVKTLTAEQLKAKLAEKVVVTAVVEKVAVKEDVKSTVTAVACLGDKVLAKGETEVSLSAAMPFVDVASDAYYAEPVLWAVDKKITVGTTTTTFSPDWACTRAQIVTFLWRYSGSPKATSEKNPFTDVASTAYYYDAVLWAVEKGITVGTSATTFSPDAPCTRGQFVTFLWRFDGEKKVEKAENPFTDVAASDYYYDAVLWAVDTGVTVGMSATTFVPSMNCSRAHVVTFLHRYDGLQKAADETPASAATEAPAA